MKKFKSLLCAAGVLGAMALASCTDLTENIYSELTKDNYYIDPQSVESAVVRCYEHSDNVTWRGYLEIAGIDCRPFRMDPEGSSRI